VINWTIRVAVANSATEARERNLALQSLEKSSSQPSRALGEQAGGLSGNLPDVVEWDGLDRICGSLRTLLCRTLGCALSTPSAYACNSWPGHWQAPTQSKGRGIVLVHIGVPGGSGISSHRGSVPWYGITLASGHTGSCPASLEISTSRAICDGTYCQCALPVSDGSLTGRV
jgi:hypothetical protein